MRTNFYLNEPYEEKELHSLVSEIKFNPKLSDIRDIAKKQKSENILNIIPFNEFESGSTKREVSRF